MDRTQTPGLTFLLLGAVLLGGCLHDEAPSERSQAPATASTHTHYTYLYGGEDLTLFSVDFVTSAVTYGARGAFTAEVLAQHAWIRLDPGYDDPGAIDTSQMHLALDFVLTLTDGTRVTGTASAAAGRLGPVSSRPLQPLPVTGPVTAPTSSAYWFPGIILCITGPCVAPPNAELRLDLQGSSPTLEINGNVPGGIQFGTSGALTLVTSTTRYELALDCPAQTTSLPRELGVRIERCDYKAAFKAFLDAID